MLTTEELLAGADCVYQIDVPERLVPGDDLDRRVQLKPLTVRDLRLISRAAQDNDDLTAALMVRQALVEPALELEELNAVPAGLLQFLVREVNRISGITAVEDEILAALEDPLTHASLLLSRELGWTPEEIGRLTMGEVMLHIAALRASA